MTKRDILIQSVSSTILTKSQAGLEGRIEVVEKHRPATSKFKLPTSTLGILPKLG
jgi:hypothetical protein